MLVIMTVVVSSFHIGVYADMHVLCLTSIIDFYHFHHNADH